MWFDECFSELDNCSTCLYSKKDITKEPCSSCYVEYLLTQNLKYYKKNKKGDLYDRIIQWNTRFREIFAHG